MTNKEAIEIIKVATAEVEWNYPLNYAVAFEKAPEALEKQMPKKPIESDWVRGITCEEALEAAGRLCEFFQQLKGGAE